MTSLHLVAMMLWQLLLRGVPLWMPWQYLTLSSLEHAVSFALASRRRIVVA